MPSGEELDVLLPAQVGPFRRDDVRSTSIYAHYASDAGGIFVELGICDDAASAQQAVETARSERDAEHPEESQQLSLNTGPSFLKTNTELGAFMAWTRGNYYFSAHAESGEEDLDAFMDAFPY